MTPATWWALAFIAACVVLIVWVRVKYPLPTARRSVRANRRPTSRRQPGRAATKSQKRR